MPIKCLATRQPYKIASICTSDPPSGAEGSYWYHYVIVQGSNTIHGYQQGSLESITLAVEKNVVLLNERQLGKRGNSYLRPKIKK